MKTNRFSFLALMLIIFSYSYSQSDFLKVEPPFWWTGMHSPNLQIMVYGEDAGEYTPTLEYKGVQIDSVVRPGNDHYLFIYLTISQDTKPGSFYLDFQKDGQTTEKYNYHLYPRRKGSADRLGFNTSDIIYLITPDRFANGDTTNDNIVGYPDKVKRSDKDGRHGGDIQGIIDHLDYIDNMGFTALWINPLIENNQPKYSYHGYSITDFYKTDPRHGTNEDYKRLVKEAHKRDLKVIMDMILNHCGSEHWWMDDLPSEDWINYGGKFVMTNHRRATIQDPYRSEEDTRRMSDGWFVETMPDMNQRNHLLADYLIYNSIWWIEYADLDGIRMDTYPYPDKDFMAEWTCRVMEEYPNFNIVGEEWTTNPALIAHWQRGKVNPGGYTSCLPSLFDFPLQAALLSALVENEDKYFSGWIKLYEMLANDFLYADPYNMVIFCDNHDMSRFYTEVGENRKKFMTGIAWLMTMRGIPQVYYGTEIMMGNPLSRSHGEIRSDFPGGWPGDTVNVFTGEGLTKEQEESLAFFRRLHNWRKGKDVIHNGNLMQFAPEDGVYVFFRYDDHDKVMTILNKSGSEQMLELSRFREMLNGITKGRDVISGRTLTMKETLTLPAGMPLILELE